jgi:hypothetical protein
MKTAPQKLVRLMETKVKIVDEEKGIVDYIASTQTLDWHREIVMARGWKFTHFRKHSPFVDSHDYSTIGKLLGGVTNFEVKEDKLIERVQWAIDVPECALAQLGWKMTLAGYLKSVSVGFMPIKIASRFDDDRKAYDKLLQQLGIDDEEKAPNYIYVQQEQLELSSCILGANPDALIKAHQDHAIKDADLAALGLNDDEIADLLKNFSEQKPGKTAPPATPPAPAGDAAKEQGRASFLGKLETLTKGK